MNELADEGGDRLCLRRRTFGEPDLRPALRVGEWGWGLCIVQVPRNQYATVLPHSQALTAPANGPAGPLPCPGQSRGWPIPTFTTQRGFPSLRPVLLILMVPRQTRQSTHARGSIHLVCAPQVHMYNHAHRGVTNMPSTRLVPIPGISLA